MNKFRHLDAIVLINKRASIGPNILVMPKNLDFATTRDRVLDDTRSDVYKRISTITA